MDADAFAGFGINVEKLYKSKFKPEDLPLNEKCPDYFKRCHKLLTSIIKETRGKNIRDGVKASDCLVFCC